MNITGCKVCGSNRIVDIFTSVNAHGRHLISEKDRFVVSRCKSCGVVFLKDVKVNGSYYKKYYELGYYDQASVKKGSLLDKFLDYISKFSIQRKEKLIRDYTIVKKKRISILDVGCGSGNFLFNLDESRFDRFGTEINQEGFEISQKRGLHVFFGDLDKINFGKKKFDVASLWQVLEHVKEPKKLMGNINRILLPGGIVIFQVPNTDGLGFKIGKKDWFHLDSPRHLILYNPQSVSALCATTGFKIVRIVNEFYDYPLDLFWSMRNSSLRFIIYPLYPIFKLFSQEHLTYICKKV